MPKTKPRIDKKNALTFRLVHRSQHDPLIADETAPKGVLQEINTDKDKKNIREEQVKYGVYFDDDYDYLKHLKARDEFDREWELIEEKQKEKKTKLNLPSSVFPSVIEEDEGMLNKAAPVTGPQPDLDPDVIAALDDDFDLNDPNNQLTDDYLQEIISGGPLDTRDEDADDEDWEDDEEHEEKEQKHRSSYSINRFKQEQLSCQASDNRDDEDDQDDESDNFVSDDEETVISKKGENRLREKLFEKEETKSCFTEYSMTSSILPRNEGLSLIDEKFEAMFEKEYGNDMDMGALDFDDIEGRIDPNKSALMKKLIEEDEIMKNEKYVSEADKLKILRLNCGSDDDEDDKNLVTLKIEKDVGKNRERMYDCESILSTYSNLYNHPKLIREEKEGRNYSKKIAIDPATGMVVSSNSGLTRKNLKQLDEINGDDSGSGTEEGGRGGAKSSYSRASRISELSERPKDETPEERRQRKAAFKEFKKERRLEKKANKLAFKLETDKHNKDIVRLKNGIVAMKLV